MMFSRDGWPVRALGAAATVVLAALAACGGGEQVEKFQPTRVLAFGDENNYIRADGIKYTVNYISPSTATPPSTIDCAQNPVGVQTLANAYGVPFPECPGGFTSAPSRMLSTVGARVVDVNAQVDNFELTDSFHAKDLVMVLAGSNDLLAIYNSTVTGGVSGDQAVAMAEQTGTNLANIVNRIANAGAKVIISTIPDLSLTPDGRTDPAKNSTLHTLSQRFNAKLRTGLNNDGHKIGLVLFDENVQAIVNSGVYVVSIAACNDATVADVTTCTTDTLRALPDGTTASLATWLWADGTHIAPLGHNTLGSAAFTRASNNPF